MARLLTGRWIGGSLLVLAVLGVGWMYLRAQQARDLAYPERARRDGRPIPVRTAPVTQMEVERAVGGTAVTIPSERAIIRVGPSRGLSINSPVSQIVIQAVHVQEGQQVRQGQLLFEIDDEVLEQVVKQKEIALNTARAELERIQEAVSLNQDIRKLDLTQAEAALQFRSRDLENREQQFQTERRLYGEKASTLIDFYETRAKHAEAGFRLSEAEMLLQRAKRELTVGALADKQALAKATNDFEAARIELALARQDVERCQIKSPIDGFVSGREIAPGVSVPINASLLEVIKLDPVYLRVDFPQEQVGAVSIGQPAEIVLDSFPGETFTGTVSQVLPEADPQLRVLPILVEVKNPGGRIKAGLSGYVRLYTTQTATTVPSAAVIQRDGRAVVFRVEDSRARLRPVRTGSLVKTGTLEVCDGLTPGDEVVVFHNFYRHAGRLTEREGYLQDNDLVDVNWREWARRE